ncbi:MAG: diguanylate cyclase [Niastella sp. SCN 39-18]|nr:GAF domain-containing protein [Sphingobacteriales bacterium]ODT52501.1 MAG: diguanylate cyclase [Niastella sp. SCN 39-18]OJW11641.1 MAG: diguanylate cyclase [Sphingobacteriales bacterium 39-19]
MSEDLHIVQGTKEEQYRALLPQVQAVLEGETDAIAAMANVAAALKEQFGWLWIGFYRVVGNELVLGPFQGPIACIRIQKGQGVCGQAWQLQQNIIVPDVNQFPGHIACSSLSQSEIVLPVIRQGKTVAVLDADDIAVNRFDSIDEHWLQKMIGLLPEPIR